MSSIENPPAEDAFRVREYLSVLRKRKWSILALTLIAVIAAVGFASSQTPIYTSQSKVQATNPTSSFQANPLAEVNTDTEKALVGATLGTKCASQILQSPATIQRILTNPSDPILDQICSLKTLATVVPDPGLKKNLSVTAVANTTILSIGFSDPKPARAQAGAEAFAAAYVHIKTEQALVYVASLAAGPQKQLTLLNAHLADLQGQYVKAVQAANTAQANLISQEISATNNQIFLIQQQLQLVSPSKLILPTVAADATLPTKPSSPNTTLDGIVGLLVGLAFGIGLAFLRERLDDRLRGRADFEERIGAPVLSVIPKVSGWRTREDAKLITIEQPKSAPAEAYRTLRTSVLFTANQQGLKTLIVASPSAGEGKTTTAANLAVVLADAKRRVILVSADLRKPRIHRFFPGMKNDVGLSNVLAGEAKPWEALQDPKVENLRVMASGPVPGRPAELLQSEQMGELLAELQEVADFIIIDSAPVLVVSDALALVPLVDGVLFVADSETTPGTAVSQAREQLEQVGATVIGAVLNNFDPSRARGYGYYQYGNYRYRYGSYSYGYTSNEGSDKGRARQAIGRRRG